MVTMEYAGCFSHSQKHRKAQASRITPSQPRRRQATTMDSMVMQDQVSPHYGAIGSTGSRLPRNVTRQISLCPTQSGKVTHTHTHTHNPAQQSSFGPRSSARRMWRRRDRNPEASLQLQLLPISQAISQDRGPAPTMQVHDEHVLGVSGHEVHDSLADSEQTQTRNHGPMLRGSVRSAPLTSERCERNGTTNLHVPHLPPFFLNTSNFLENAHLFSTFAAAHLDVLSFTNLGHQVAGITCARGADTKAQQERDTY